MLGVCEAVTGDAISPRRDHPFLMDGVAAGPDAYLEAFMNGFEFVLLAIRGRLAEDSVPAAERARLEAFLEDYWRLVNAYKERTQAEPDSPLVSSRPFRAQASMVTTN